MSAGWDNIASYGCKSKITIVSGIIILTKSCGWKVCGFEEWDLHVSIYFVLFRIRSCWVVQTVSLGLHLFTATTVLKCHRDIVVSIFFLLTAAEFLCHLSLLKDLYSLTESTHPAPVFVQPFLQRDVTGWGEELVCVSAAERHGACRWSRGDHE